MLNLSRMYLLQTFMLLIPVSCAVFCPGCCKCGDVTPINPYILTGQQLLLYCRLDNETIQNYDVNSSHVQFIKGDTLISQNNVMILNESTAVLNITINELSDKGTYYCLFNSEKQALFDNKFVGRQVVKVEYYPQKIPEDSIHCVVYDWSYNLTCYWKTPDVKYANEENIETKVYWKNYKSFNECINIENNYCTPSTKDGSPIVVEALGWEFKFEVTNNKTNTTVRSYYRFMEFDFVKPSPVSTFSSEIINSTCVRLKWDHPRPHRDKFYEISYISKWDNEMQLLNTSIQATTIVICDLIPYTVYNFTIGVYPDEKSGYRSNLVPTKARTNQNIPDRPPEMTEGSYISSLDNCGKDIQHRNVTIYWKAVPERYLNGRLTGYTLQYREGHQLKNRPIKPDKTSEKIQVQCSHTYTMEIKAKTVVGYTENAASIKVLGTRKKDIKPPSIIHELNTTHNLVNVSWSSAYPVSEVKGYTVYWCLYTNKYICDSEINWHHVSGNESSLIIPCKNCKDTLFGVSMETSSGSSGFIWNSCLYIKDANPVPPKPVFGQSPPNKGLTVTWTADYCNGDSPYIRGYKVRYCEADKEHKTCKDKVSESKLIPTGDTKRYDIHGLDATKTYGVSVRSFSWNGESPDSELIIGQPSNSDLTDGAIAGISIAGVFVACLAIAGLIFCCRVCKKKSAEIRKPYDIAVPIIKTSQLNGNGNFIGYTNISEPSTPVESHQLLNGFINGGIHANGGIQKQISRDSGHESITSETPNSPSPDQVASKPNELLVPVIEESDVSNNSNVLSSKNTEESALSENLYPNKYYSQVAMLMSESDDSSLRPSGDLTDEGRQNPVFINSSPPREKIFTVAHVTSVQLDNENPFYPNAKKSLPHNQPATTEIINPQDSSKGEASASPYVKADLGSERSSNMKTNPDGHVSDPPYISADLESGSTPVTPYVKGDLCSESNSVSPYVKGDMCSGNTSVSPNGKDGMSSGSTSVSPYVKGDLCSGSPASVSPYTSAGLIKGSENPQLGSVLENNDTSVDISNDVSDYQKANYEDFVNPLFDADLYESDKDSVSDYVTNAGIETAADRKDSVSDYVTNGGIQSAADGSSIDDYITNAAENESCIEGYVPPISEDSNSMNSAGNIANLDVSQTKSEEAQNEINDDVISESTDVDYVAEVPKPNDMDSIDASSNSEFKVSSEDESTTSSTGLLFSNLTNKNVSSDNVTNGYIYSPDLDSKDSFENINHESALPISYHNSLSTSDSEQNGYVTDLSETAVLEKKDSCSLSNPPSSAENKDSCSNSPACSSSLTTPLNNSGYLTHDVLSGEGLQSSDNKMKTNLEMNGYISEGHLKNT